MTTCEYSQVRARAALPLLSEEMLELVASRFKLLGDPVRLRILQFLEDGEHTVGDITGQLEANQSNISKHLQVLRDGGILSRRKDGNQVFYSIEDPMIFKLCELVCRGVAGQVQRQAAIIPARLMNGLSVYSTK